MAICVMNWGSTAKLKPFHELVLSSGKRVLTTLVDNIYVLVNYIALTHDTIYFSSLIPCACIINMYNCPV